MGTRSIHVFPCVNKYGRWKDDDRKWVMQYIQFDGYPSEQIYLFALDFKDRYRHTFQVRHDTYSKECMDEFFEYLRAYYYLRSFETYHSINNVSFVNTYGLGDLTKYGCDYSYEWYDNRENNKNSIGSFENDPMIYLTITKVSSNTRYSLSFEEFIAICEEKKWDPRSIGNAIDDAVNSLEKIQFHN